MEDRLLLHDDQAPTAITPTKYATMTTMSHDSKLMLSKALDAPSVSIVVISFRVFSRTHNQTTKQKTIKKDRKFSNEKSTTTLLRHYTRAHKLQTSGVSVRIDRTVSRAAECSSKGKRSAVEEGRKKELLFSRFECSRKGRSHRENGGKHTPTKQRRKRFNEGSVSSTSSKSAHPLIGTSREMAANFCEKRRQLRLEICQLTVQRARALPLTKKVEKNNKVK